MDAEQALRKALENPPPYPSEDSCLTITIDTRGYPKASTVRFNTSLYKGELPSRKFESFYVAKLGDDGETVSFALFSSRIEELVDDKKLASGLLRSAWAYTYREVVFENRNGTVYITARLPPKVMCMILGIDCYRRELAGKQLFFPVTGAEAITYKGQVIGIAITVRVERGQAQ